MNPKERDSRELVIPRSRGKGPQRT